MEIDSNLFSGVRRSRRSRWRLLIFASVMATAVPAALVGAGWANAAERTDPDPLRAFRTQSLAWGPCEGKLAATTGLRCASMKAPLDYGDPDGERITVSVSRLDTSEPGKRRGVLLLNPGGPGGPARSTPVVFRDRAPGSVLQRYDLIGMDPRGLAPGTSVACGLSETDSTAWN